MLVYRFHLFGSFTARTSAGAELAFRTDKIRALLAYLLLERERPHPREALADLLWSDAPRGASQHNLRLALSRLRDSLGKEAEWLEITRRTVQVHPSSAMWVDVLEYDQLRAQAATLSQLGGALNPLAAEALRRALALYTGDFLADINVRDSSTFEHWSVPLQSRYQQHSQRLREQLAEDALARGEFDLAEQYAQQQLAFTPWLETAHRQLMRVYAQRGQWPLVRRQYEQCAALLKTELGLAPDPATEALLAELSPTTQSSTPPRLTAPTPPSPVQNNLPRATTPFFGREAELDQLRSALLDNATSLVTIVGPGGAGKTRLASEVAHQFSESAAFPDGVWLVALDSLRGDEPDLPSTIAALIVSTLHLGSKGSQPALEQLLNGLRDQRRLLLLDNFEQLIREAEDGVEVVHRLLAHTRQLKLLVTSRKPLELQSERLVRLEGLPVPNATDASALAVSSMRLFVERGQRAKSDLTLDPPLIDCMARICQTLDGLPLSLELAAARLREIPCLEIAAAIQNSLDVLQTRWRDLPPRQRSLRAVFEWSWALLPPEEQQALAALSVFHGAFTAAAAQAVAGASTATLDRLRAHSLLRAEQPGLYALHDLVRHFGAEQVGADNDLLARHSAYYLNRLAECVRPLLGEHLSAVAAALQLEIEDLFAAWEWAATRQRLDALAEASLGLELFLNHSGLFWDGERLFRAALQTEPEEASHAVARLQLSWARCRFWRAEYAEAQTLAEAAAQTGEHLGDIELAASGWAECGRIAWRQGRYPAAEGFLERAVTRAPSHSWAKAQALSFRANLAVSQQRFAEATALNSQALVLQTDLGIWVNRDRVVNSLAVLAAQQHDYERALPLFEQARQIAQQLNQRYMLASIVHNLAGLYFERGRYGEALTQSQEALVLCRTLRDQQGEATAALALGIIYLEVGHYGAAQDHLTVSLNFAQQGGLRLMEATTWIQMALLHYAQGHAPLALNALQSVRQIAQATPLDALSLIQIEMQAGYCHVALTHSALAEEFFQQAFTLSERAGLKGFQAEALCGMARLTPLSASALVSQAIALCPLPTDWLEALLPFEALLTCLQVLPSAQAEPFKRFIQMTLTTRAESLSEPERGWYEQKVAKYRGEAGT